MHVIMWVAEKFGKLPGLGFSKTVTTVPAAVLSPNVKCVAVAIQSSSKDDSNAAMTGVMYILLNGVKVRELVQGEDHVVVCSNTSEVQIATLSGTAWARGEVYRVGA